MGAASILALAILLCAGSPLVAEPDEPSEAPPPAGVTTAALDGDAASTDVPSQPPIEEQLPQDSNPLQTVFFSVRDEYNRLPDGSWINTVILRSDRVLLKDRPKWGGKVGLLTRFDLPLVAVNLGGASERGLGDLYLQAVHAPMLTRRFGLGIGTGLVVPTASDPLLGGGKWRIEPLVVPVWFLPRAKAMAFVLVKRQLSFTGAGDRPDVDATQIIPTFLGSAGRRWLYLVDTQVKVDHRAGGRVSLRSGLEIGLRMRGSYAVLVKPEIPWGGNQESDWRLRITVTRYRQR